MKADVKQMDKVHVFILRSAAPWLREPETAADLPYMWTNGLYVGEMVYVRRRESKLLCYLFRILI